MLLAALVSVLPSGVLLRRYGARKVVAAALALPVLPSGSSPGPPATS